jgi:hypothetical protein
VEGDLYVSPRMNYTSFLCGGGIESLHRSPASRKRRRKGNPVPGDIARSPCYWRDINTGIWPSILGESQELKK